MTTTWYIYLPSRTVLEIILWSNSPSTLCNNHGMKYVSTSEKKLTKLNYYKESLKNWHALNTHSHFKTKQNNFQLRSGMLETRKNYLFPLDRRSNHFRLMNQTLKAQGPQGNSTFGIKQLYCQIRLTIFMPNICHCTSSYKILMSPR